MKMRRNFLKLSCSLVVILLTITGAYAGEVLKIGLANPMTGDYAPYGEGNGAACMVEMINKTAGPDDITVELMMEDSRSDPQLTLSLAQKYLDAGAVIVHGTPFPDSLIPMAKMAEKYNLMGCIESGCCAYICPANLPLVQLIRMGKALVIASKQK